MKNKNIKATLTMLQWFCVIEALESAGSEYQSRKGALSKTKARGRKFISVSKSVRAKIQGGLK